MDFSNYLFRAHMVGKIITVPKPLTENQTKTLEAFKLKRYPNITDKQKETFVSLENKLIESKKFKLTDANKKTLSGLVYATKYGRRTAGDSSLSIFTLINNTGNYFALAKNYVKDFGICSLNENEKNFLLNTDSSEERNDFLLKKYRINPKVLTE